LKIEQLAALASELLAEIIVSFGIVGARLLRLRDEPAMLFDPFFSFSLGLKLAEVVWRLSWPTRF
jgi:hypothetical protein